MKLVVIKQTQEPNILVCHLKFMHGDADIYTEETIEFSFPDEIDNIESFLKYINKSDGGRDRPVADGDTDWSDYWPSDKTGWDGPASLEEMSWTFFDEDSAEWDVHVLRTPDTE